jgi:D-alanyl-D-alanine carboxypeptidase
MIAEKITEMSFRELVDYWIVRPLNLQRTAVVEEISDLNDLVPAPSEALSTDGRTRDIRFHYHPGWVSHGLIASTPSEIVRFYTGLVSGEILTEHTLEEMTKGVPVADDSPQWGCPSYGLGLMIDPESRHGRFLGHGGGGPGTTTFAAHFPDQGLTICIMAAGENRKAEEGVWGIEN